MALEVTLHLGAHRTGSSALQRALAGNRGKLMASGMGFWGPGIVRNLLGHAVLRAAVEGRKDKAAEAEFKAVAERVRARFQQDMDAGASDLVISEENLLGTMAANLWQARLYPHVGVRLQTFLKLLPEAPKRMFLTVRDYASYWASSYGFAALRNDLPEFSHLQTGLVTGERGWGDVVADIQKAAPEIPLFIRPYQSDNDALARFLREVAGAERMDALSINIKRNNQGLSAAALDHALARKRANPALDPQNLTAGARHACGDEGARFMPFDAEEKARLEECFGADLAAIAKLPGVTMLEEAV